MRARATWGNTGTTRGLCTIGGALWIALQTLTLSTTAQASSPTLTTLYNFAGGPSDGSQPITGVVIGPGGVLYGTTESGGSENDGTIFSLTPPASPGGAWTEGIYSILFGTGGVSGVVAGNSALYGTTFDGPKSNGTVSSVTLTSPPGGGRVIYSFRTRAAGRNPRSVTIGSSGVLYGATYEGGTSNCGVVFSLTPPAAAGGAWTESVIYNVTKSDGCMELIAPLVIGSGGVIYAADQTGDNFDGKVFSLTPPATPGGAWTHTVIHGFRDPDGAVPGGLVIGSGGVIYGNTLFGGAYGYGTVFSLTPPSASGGAWTETTLYSFTGGTDGSSPSFGVVIGPGGVLYGTTGYPLSGSVFSLTPPTSPGGSWTEVSLHNFTNGADGGSPSGLTIDSAGVLYGTTKTGGSLGNGTVFSLQP